MKYTNKARRHMLEKGLHERHSLDHPLLRDFAKHLEKDLLNESYKPEVRTIVTHSVLIRNVNKKVNKG